jgi:chemotaxis protein CheX
MSTAVAPQSSALTAEYINPVISATRTVFETMLGCTPTRTGLALKDDKTPSYELSAVIGISGKTAGTIVLSLSQVAAIRVLNRLVGVEATSINSEVCDAVGELTNMIAGSAKAQMERLQLAISIPNVVSGKNHEVHFPSNVRPICIEFDSEIGKFAIQVGFSGLN